MFMACSVRSRLKGGVIGLGLGRFVFAGAGVIGVLGGPVFAGPEGAQVVRGSATISQSGATTTIQAGNNAIINYSRFNIGAGETVRFVQPSATSRVLNRVTGIDPTHIDGTMQSNGIVYLANPAGVFFGGNAVVNCAGLYAAASKISNENFLAGVDHFTDVKGDVVNSGFISASAVNLIGQHVANHGTIIANGGVVAMAAGRDVYLGEYGGNIVVRVEGGAAAAATATARAGVENTGTIQAPRGRVNMAVGDVYSLAIRNTGSVRARDITLKAEQGAAGGGVVKVSGRLDASGTAAGESGGTVRVLGDKIALSGATIDASGPAGGGEILVGGDYQGKGGANGDIPNAARVNVSADSTLRADATQAGDGGKVIVWSDEVTRFDGRVSARGGAAGGDGGFAEVSGKETLAFTGKADLSAPAGVVGTLLLDPRDIIIDNAGPAALTDVDNFTDTASTDVSIAAATINAAVANVILQANRDIFVNEAINIGGAGVSLTMQAGRAISISQDITVNNADITLIANERAGAGVVDADRDAGDAFIVFAAGAELDAGNGTIRIDLNDGAGLTNSTSGHISLGSITTTGDAIVRNLGPSAGSSIFRSESGALVTAATVGFDVAGAGGFGAVGTSAAPIRLQVNNVEARAHANGIFLDSPSQGLAIGGAALGGLTGLETAGGGAIVVSAAGPLAVDEHVTTTLSTGRIALDAEGGISVNADIASGGAALSLNADSDADGAGTLTVGAARNVTSAGGALTVSGADLDLQGLLNAGAGSVRVSRSNGGSIGLGAAVGDMSISNAELANITAENLNVGGPTTTLIAVDGVGGASTDNINGLVSLIANGSGGVVQFSGGQSRFHTLTVRSAGGISVGADLAIDEGPLTLRADTDANGVGDLSVSPSVTIATAGADLVVSAADLALNGAINTGSGSVSVSSTRTGGIALGAAGSGTQMSIGGAELERITAGDLNVGGSDTTAIAVDGVVATDVANVNRVNLVAGSDSGSITFSGAASTFRTLTATANDSIHVQADLTTTVGDLSLKADNDGQVDGGDAILITAGRAIASAWDLKLEATRGGIQAAGAVTLEAARSVAVRSSFNSPTGIVTVNADSDAEGVGSFIVAADTVFATGGALNISAADIDLAGSLSSGTAAMSVRPSVANGFIGIGDTPGDMTISRGELSRITAGSLQVGGNTTNRIFVDNIQSTDSAGVSGPVVLTANANGGRVEFLNNASTFNALTANADDYINVSASLTSLSASITLNADTDAAADTSDAIQIGGGVTVNSNGDLGLSAPTGGLRLTGADGSDATLIAVGGGAINLPNVTSDHSANLSVFAQGALSLGSVNVNNGAFSATADSDSNSAAISLVVGQILAGSITLGAGTDADDTITITQTLAPSGDLTIKNAATVTVNDGVDLTPGGSLNAASGITTIVLGGTAGSRHTLSSRNDGLIALAPITANNAVDLLIDSQGRVNAGAINIGSGTLEVRVDSDNDETQTADLGTLSAGRVVVNSSGGNDTVTFGSSINASGSGGVQVDSGAMILTGNVNAPAGPIALTGAISLAGDLTITTGAGGADINLNGPINGARNLTVAPGTGSVHFAGAVGGVTPLNGLSVPTASGITTDSTITVGNQSLSLAADDIRLGGSVTSDGGDLSFVGPVVFTSDAVVSGKNISFSGTVNSGSVARTLVVNSTSGGTTTFTGAIGGLSPLLSLITNNDGTTKLSGDVTTLGGNIAFNDAVLLLADIAVRALGGGSIQFASTVNSENTTTARSLTVAVDTAAAGSSIPTISFGNTVGQTAPLADLRLNNDPNRSVDGRSAPASVASIIFRQFSSDGTPLDIAASGFNPAFNFVVRVTRDLIIGLNEKVTSLGAFRVQAGRNARLSDISTAGNLAVTAQTIQARNRAAGSVLDSSGATASDAGIDFVSGGTVTFSVAPTNETPGLAAPTFATESGTGDTNGVLSNFAFRQFGDITPGIFVLNGTVLDLRSQGPTNTNIATVLAGATPDPQSQGFSSDSSSPGASLRRELDAIGITTRGMTAEESLQAILGRALYSDVPATASGRTPGVSEVRLSASQVRATLDAYAKVFTKPDSDPTAREARTTQIRTALADAMSKYQSSPQGQRFDPAQFRAFVDSNTSTTDASVLMADLENLFDRLALTGLSSGEQANARRGMLRDITPSTMTIPQLEAAVRSRTQPVGG